MWIIQSKKKKVPGWYTFSFLFYFFKYLGIRGNLGFGRLFVFILVMTACITWCQGSSQIVRKKFVVPSNYVIKGTTSLIKEIGEITIFSLTHLLE